jgi:PAS domain S-box-containing protein
MPSLKKSKQKVKSSQRKEDLLSLENIDPSKLYSSIYENPLVCIYLSDLEGNFLDGNQTSLDLLGYSRKDIRKLDFASLLSDEDLERSFDVLQRTIRKGRQEKVEEFALRRKDGTFMPVNTVTNFIYENGEPIALHGMSVDISEQKNAELALRNSEKKYRAIMDYAPDPILIADTEGNIIDSNPRARELFGYSKREFQELHFTQLHPQEDLERIKETFNGIINRKMFRVGDVHIKTKAGRIIDVDINGTYILLEDQSLVVGVFRDITNYRKRQEVLEKAKKELDATIAERTMELIEANTALKVLLSHQNQEKAENEEKLAMNFRNQILPYIHELKKKPLDAKQKSCIRMIEKNLQGIMSEFLTHLKSTALKLTPKEIQVASLIKEGMSTKEIARFLNVSRKTVDIFRYNIRKKLGLNNNRRESLMSHLLSL